MILNPTSTRPVGHAGSGGGDAASAAWCPRCRKQVELTNLRAWPEGILVVGECPECSAALAASRPVGWNGVGASHSAA